MIFALYFTIGVAIYLYALLEESAYRPDFYAFFRQLVISGLLWPFLIAYVLVTMEHDD